MPTSHLSNTKIIAITLGDPGGIGPEVILKSFEQDAVTRYMMSPESGSVFFVCIGALRVLEDTQRIIGTNVQLHRVESCDPNVLRPDCLNVVDVSLPDEEYRIGTECASNARVSLAAVEYAAELVVAGGVHAIATGPINKEACSLLRPGFTGHTELLASIDNTKVFAMMLSGGPLRVVMVTTHVPLASVPGLISTEKVYQKIVLTDSFLKNFLNIAKPRIGVAGLNPHAGEGGKMGREEIDVIAPAVERAAGEGYSVTGPYPPDTIFHKAYTGGLDAIICMYHDQGLGPMKMIAFESGINVTMGLSFVRTSCDHGTAFDIAYQNKAHCDSMLNAIVAAIDMAHKK